MKTVIFIHGGDSYSHHDYFIQALKTAPIRNPEGKKDLRWPETLLPELSGRCQFLRPTMPNSDNANYLEWKIWFERFLSLAQNPLILIGWSLGGMFLAKYLLENDLKVEGLILIGSPYATFEDDLGNDCGSFRSEGMEVGRLAEQADQIHIVHSKDDFVVPYEHAEKFKAALPASALHTFNDKNHFLEPEFPEIIDIIKKML